MGDLVTITPAAAARARALLDRTGSAGLRVRVQSAGCDGFQALLDLAASPRDDEIEVQESGVALFVDVASMLALPGAVLDHQQTKSTAEFVWTHPASTGPCRCAEADLEAVLHGDA